MCDCETRRDLGEDAAAHVRGEVRLLLSEALDTLGLTLCALALETTVQATATTAVTASTPRPNHRCLLFVLIAAPLVASAICLLQGAPRRTRRRQ